VPDNWKSFVGDYIFQNDWWTANASISGSSRGLRVHFSFSVDTGGRGIVYAPLLWSGQNATFRLLPTPGSENSCFISSVEQIVYQWLLFDDLNNPKSFRYAAVTGWDTAFVRTHKQTPAMTHRARLDETLGSAVGPQRRRKRTTAESDRAKPRKPWLLSKY